jgi:hypothetical protein
MSEVAEAVAELRVRRDLEAAPVETGTLRGDWQILGFQFPYLCVRIAADPAVSGVASVDVRFQVDGYPDTVPEASAWDSSSDRIASEIDRPNVGPAALIFRSDCEAGRVLYHPSTRYAIHTHSDWPRLHVDELWEPQRGIEKLLASLRVALVGL